MQVSHGKTDAKKINHVVETTKQKPIGKNEIDTLIKSIEKPKEVKSDHDLRLIMQMFRPSLIMKVQKFKGRELLECLKRITLKTAFAGDLLQHDG